MPDRDIKTLDDELQELNAYVNARGEFIRFRNELPRNVWSDIYPWLRIGWVDVAGTFYGYLTFSKEEHTVTAKFENLHELIKFRNAMSQAHQD